MSDAFILLDREFRVAYVNSVAEATVQMPRHPLFGRTLWELWPASVGSELEERFRLAMDTGEAQHFQHHYVDGELDLWIEVNAYPNAAGVAIYYRDITAKKLAQQAAARVERAYKAALSNTPDFIYVFSLDHHVLYANEALLNMWGKSWEDAIGKGFLEIGYPEWHAAMHNREIDQVAATRLPLRGEVPFDGTLGRRIYEYIFVPVFDEHGQVELVAGTTRDVTERLEAENILRGSEERLRIAQKAGRLATWDWDLATGEVVWAEGSEPLYGRPPAEMTPIQRCAEAVHPEDQDSTMQALNAAIANGVEYNHEFRVVWPDGSVHWLDGRGKASYDAEGSPIRIIGVNLEITARKQAEELRRTEQQRLGDLLMQAPVFMALLRGPEHVFERTNPLYDQLVGNRQLIGRSVREAIPEAAEQGFVELLDGVLRSGEPFTAYGQRLYLRRDAERPPDLRYLNFVYQPMRTNDGDITGVIVVGVDVTESRLAEEALQRSEKLATAGRLASSIAHEINNPLEAVTNLLYLMQADESLGVETRRYLTTAESELARVSEITTQTLRFYRQSTLPTKEAISGVLDSILALYDRRISDAGIHLERRASRTPLTLVFAGELRQVIANLIGNALDALGPDGRIFLRDRAATDWTTGRKGIRITVADTGHGMDAATQQRIFEAFYSTKSATGTGLGLWVSNEIVQKQGGRIRVRSSRGERHGTVFTVFLPEIADPI